MSMRSFALSCALTLLSSASPLLAQNDGAEPTRGVDRPDRAPVAVPAEAVDAELEKWIATLAEHVQKDHPQIRASATAGLAAVGAPAIPMLKTLIGKAEDAGKKSALEAALRRVEQRQEPRRRGPGQGEGEGGRRDRMGDPREQAAAIAAELELDEANATRLGEALVEMRARQREAYRRVRDLELGRVGLSAELRAARAELVETLRTFLTAAQLEQAMREIGLGARRDGDRGRGRGRGRGGEDDGPPRREGRNDVRDL